MMSILDEIRTLYDSSECKMDKLCKHVDELRSLANAEIDKVKEMYYRKHAVEQFLRRLENNKHYDLLKNLVMELRFFRERRWQCEGPVYLTDDGYNEAIETSDTEHFTRHSVEIALKCAQPTQLYVMLMNCYLKKHIDGIRGICSIICEYSHNGYIWYNLNYNEQDYSDKEPKDWMERDKGIMYEVHHTGDEHGYYDYFMDNSYHHNCVAHGKAVSFDSLRNDLGCGKLNGLQDEDIAEVIATICDNIFHFDKNNLWEPLEDWIEDKHKKVEKDELGEDWYFTDQKFIAMP